MHTCKSGAMGMTEVPDQVDSARRMCRMLYLVKSTILKTKKKKKKKTIPERKLGFTVRWLVGCFGFNGPLRQNFSLYRVVSQREGEREQK